jgi:hypothetical protein
MDQNADLMSGPMGGSLEQQAVAMLDGVIDQAVAMVVQRFPSSARKAEETKRRIKEAAHREISQLVAEGHQV